VPSKSVLNSRMGELRVAGGGGRGDESGMAGRHRMPPASTLNPQLSP
jgi:hypothetical protein